MFYWTNVVTYLMDILHYKQSEWYILEAFALIDGDGQLFVCIMFFTKPTTKTNSALNR